MMKTCFVALLFAAFSLTSGANSLIDHSDVSDLQSHQRGLQSSKGGSGDSHPPLSSYSSASSEEESASSVEESASSEEESGKGKGKGGKGGKKSSKKSSKKDSKKDSKKGKKGLAPGASFAPSAKSAKGGKGGPTAPASPPSRNSKDGSARPPSPIPAPPTSGPPPTSPPVGINDIPVTLSPYAVAYTLGDNAMPMREDYMEVAQLTNTFFDEYMIERYEDSAQATLLRFETTMITSTFRFGEPVVVIYESIAYFHEDSTVLPRAQVLDIVLMQAFDNPVPYIAQLGALDSTNAFSTTTAVEFTEPEMMPVVSTRTSTKVNPAAIAAGAIGLTLLAAGIMLYRRREGEEEGYYTQKSFDNKPSGHGDVTVAGETYAGETYDGSASYCPSRGPSRDEEQGLENVNLAGSSTDEDTFDTSSIAQAWDADTIAENEADDRLKDDDESDEEESLEDEAEGIKEEADEDASIGESDTHSLPSEEGRSSPLQEKESNPLGEDELLDEILECISQQDEELELGEGQVESNETNDTEDAVLSEAVIDEDKVSAPRQMALEDFDAFLDSSADDAQTLSSLGNGTQFLEESPSSFLDGEQYAGEEEEGEDRSYTGAFSNRPLTVSEIETLLERDY